jgi:putative transposase
MTVSYAEGKTEVERLVEQFARNLDAYKRPGYKEARVRVEFVEPFFEALGWDVRNVRGYAERLIQTIKEEKVDLSEYIDYHDGYQQIGRFLDDVYMHRRIHSSPGYLTPAE